MTDYVFLDPDGTQGLGLFVIIERPTGVVYAHQCEGFACGVREAEGFLVPLGGSGAASPLIEFFSRVFRGNPPHSVSKYWADYWTPAVTEELKRLVATIPCWITSRGAPDDERAVLAVDDSRLREATEGWVPVVTPMGKGVLVFQNCD